LAEQFIDVFPFEPSLFNLDIQRNGGPQESRPSAFFFGAVHIQAGAAVAEGQSQGIILQESKAELDKLPRLHPDPAEDGLNHPVLLILGKHGYRTSAS
jgi:hypothetical protein